MRTTKTRPLGIVMALSALGCGTSNSGNGFGDSGTGVPPGVFGDAGTSTTNAKCAEAATLVYVVSAQYDLYSFDPRTLTFKKIGRLDCPDPGIAVTGDGDATPNSMAVDRSGTAWVNYTSGKLFKVSTANAKCEATAFVPGQSNFYKVGMAFSTNGGAGTTDETLYVVGNVDGSGAGDTTGIGLASIDLKTMKLSPIGDFNGTVHHKAAELTGTGDGKLWGFFVTQPASFAQIDKASGATPSVLPLPGVDTGMGWAFSFWGGDFWFYTGATTSSRVTQLQPAKNNTLTVVKTDVGFLIVGAGVSTCAPLEPPK
jgi:hypothetical protein